MATIQRVSALPYNRAIYQAARTTACGKRPDLTSVIRLAAATFRLPMEQAKELVRTDLAARAAYIKTWR